MRHENLKQNEEFIVSQIGTPVFQSKLIHKHASSLSMTSKMMSCLMICAIGFNMAYVNRAWSQSDDPTSGGRRSGIIIPKDKSEAISSSEMTQPESFESYQIRILRNQNHLQAEKIKQLREELMEVTQKLHELKPHLFRQGDPADKEKIAELSQQLGEKEESLTRLTTTKRDLENEVTTAKKKLNELETVKEALAAMVEKQRVAKEQNLANFKKQLDELKTTAQNEKNAFTRKIQQHESIQERLNQTLSEKGQTIQRLDILSSQQDAMLKAKQQELQHLESKILNLYDEILTLSSAFQAHQTNSDEKIQSLTASLELEKNQNAKLQGFKDEMKWISDLFDTTQDILKSEIQKLKEENAIEKATNAELQLAKAELDQRRIELALLTATHGNYRNEMEQYIQNLVAAAEMEQARTDELEKQISVHLTHQESSHRYADALEGLLAQMDDLLTSKESELSKTQLHHGETLGGLLAHLDHTDLAMESYRDQLQSLKQQVETAQIEHQNSETTWQQLQAKLNEEHNSAELDLQQKIQEALSHHHSLEELLRNAEVKSNDLSEQLQMHSEAIAQKDSQIKQLEENQSASYARFDQSVAELEGELETQVKRASAAEMALQDAILHMTRLEQELTLNKDNLNERQVQLLALHEAHAASKTDLHDQIHQLNDSLEQQKKLVNELKDELNSILEKHATDMHSHDNHLSAKQQEVDALLETQSLAKDELTARLAELSRAYDTEQKKGWELQDQLLSLNSLYDNEQLQRAQHEHMAHELMQELDEKLKLLAELEGQVAELDSKRQTAMDENSSLLEKLSNLQQKYLEEQDHTHLHSNLVEQLRGELQKSQESLAVADIWKQQLQETATLATEKDAKIQEQLDLIEHLRQELKRNETALNQIDLLEKQLSQTHEQMSQHDSTSQEQSALIEHLRQELQQTQTDLNNLSVLEQQLAATRDQLSERDSKNGEQHALIEQLRKELQQTQTALNNIEVLEQQLAGMREQLSERDSKNDEQYALIEQLRHELQQTQTALNNIEVLEQQLAGMRDILSERDSKSQEQLALISQLRHELQQTEMAMAHVKALEQKLADTQSIINEKNTHIQALNDKLLKEQGSYAERVVLLQQQLLAEKARNAELFNDLNYTRFNVAQERSNVLNLEQIVQEESAQMANLKEQLAEAQLALDTKDIYIATLNESKMLQKKNHVDLAQKLREETQQEKATRIALQEALEKTIAMQQENSAKAQSLEQQVLALQSQLQQAMETGNVLEQEKSRSQSLENQMSQLSVQHEALHSRAQQLENQLEELRQLTAQLSQAREQLTDQNQRLLNEKFEIEQHYLNQLKGQSLQENVPQDTADGTRNAHL